MIIILSLTLSGYYVFATSLVSIQENFKYINWMYLMNIHISYAYSESNVKFLLDNGLYKISDPAVVKDFGRIVKE